MAQTLAEPLMGAEADTACGAACGERRARARMLGRVPAAGVGHPGRDGRPGDSEGTSGQLFPGLSLERRRRADAALVTLVATTYPLGVSMRPLEKLVETLGIAWRSKSKSPKMARDLDGQVEAFRTRLDARPYTFVPAD